MAQALEQVGAPLGEVDDPRRHPLGVQRHAHDVDRRLQQLGGHALGEQRDRAVGGDHLPPAIDHRRRVGLVAAQHELERLAHGSHVGIVERPLAVERGVAGGEQQLVAVAQRDLELLGEPHDHLGARARAPALDEAHMAGGDAGVEGEVHLAAPPAPAPVAQQGPDPGTNAHLGHRRDDSAAPWARHLPRR